METLQTLAASYKRDRRAEGKAALTLRQDESSLKIFGEWLTAEGVSPDLAAVTRINIKAWLADMTERGLKGTTVSSRYLSLRGFCKWLVAEELLETNPMEGMKPPKVNLHLTPVLSDDQLTALLAACSGKTFHDRRDEAIFRIFIDCGVRVAEMAALKLADIDLDKETAIVHGKGGKDRPIYFSTRTVRALDRYIRMRRQHEFADRDALWLGLRGPMTDEGIRLVCYRRAQKAGIGHLHPHMFRHTFAHDYRMAGGQGDDLKRLAGWSSDMMLARYGASAADARAREAARRMKRGDRV